MQRRLRLFGALDLGFAALYLWLGLGVARGRSLALDLTLCAVSLLLGVAGGALLAGARAARRLALVASGALLAFCLTIILFLATGAAYLHGLYGPLGQGVAWVSVVVAALTFELAGLLPIAELAFLLRDDVRAHFAVEK
jgi:hypothetical protein